MERKIGIGDGPAGGWACTCPAFKIGTPTPEQAVAALERSAAVETERLDASRWLARSKGSPNTYVVVYDPTEPGGWCKHIARCASSYLPWLAQAAEGAAALSRELTDKRKELRECQKQQKRKQKEST